MGLFLITLYFCLLYSSCDSDVPEPKPNDNSTNTGAPADSVPFREVISQSLMKSVSSDFAFNLLKRCYGMSSDGNVCVSPISAQYALSMLLTGADGDTRNEIMRAIGFDPDVYDADSVNECMLGLLNELLNSDNTITLSVANSMWLHNTVGIKASYAETLSKYYHAHIGNVNLQSLEGIAMVNKWVSDATNGLISNYFDTPRDSVIALINALYLRAKWFIPFISFDSPVPMAFANDYQEWIYVPSLYGFGMGYYGVDDEYRRVFLQLGSKENNGFQVEIYMPTKERLSSCIEKISSERLNAIPGYKSDMPGGYNLVLAIPALSQNIKYDLIPVFKSMGVNTAFSSEADFSPMTDFKGLTVSDIEQQNTIKFTNWGIEAASVTSVELGITDDGQKREEIEFYVQMPYIYIVRDKKSGIILYIGTVTNLDQIAMDVTV